MNPLKSFISILCCFVISACASTTSDHYQISKITTDKKPLYSDAMLLASLQHRDPPKDLQMMMAFERGKVININNQPATIKVFPIAIKGDQPSTKESKPNYVYQLQQTIAISGPE